ncbi:unnamed protein product [Polarella glacialis]|uniref:Uncharacterized protein n=1 Tax=Polarella glacialis TaxID=89957 RepID=A0A813FP97_POLGL|nr:unnamed protein product [Polarella glacialis]CAE8615251.1 unnamed protein product [Polarella glacialis]
MRATGALCLLETGPTNEQPAVDFETDWPEVFDATTGKAIDPKLVAEARALELDYIRRCNVYRFVPWGLAKANTGRPPVKAKWVDTDKGDELRPNIRCQRLAVEIKRSWQATAFAGTPPLESLRFLVSLATFRSKFNTVERPYKMLFIDIRRAHFMADAQRELYVEIAPEEQVLFPDRMCGRLIKSMYGAQDADQNGEHEYGNFLVGESFAQGLNSPCLFYHAVRDIRIEVHGDDFTCLAHEAELLWLVTRFEPRYEIKGRLGRTQRIAGKCVFLTAF